MVAAVVYPPLLPYLAKRFRQTHYKQFKRNFIGLTEG